MDSIVKASPIQSMSTDDVLSVYSGRPGCCCGCKGKHRYNSKYQDVASVDRGYNVDDDEVNDTQVKKILNLIKNNESIVEDNGDHIALQTETRLYIVYRLPKQTKPALAPVAVREVSQ